MFLTNIINRIQLSDHTETRIRDRSIIGLGLAHGERNPM